MKLNNTSFSRLIIYFSAVFVILYFSGVHAQEPTRWRGPSGNGSYQETGLLKQWPEEGPEIAWTYDQLGQGYSSPVVDQDFVYTTGMIGEEGYLFKFDLNGKVLYKKPYGPEFTESYYGSRGSPVVADEKIYLESGLGNLLCFNSLSGSILWSRELFTEFDGHNIRWGVNETPVVDGDFIYATPGGANYNVVALNRHSGKLVWGSKGLGELSAYCSPLLFQHNGIKILVTHTQEHLIGLDAETGKIMWSKKQSNQYSVHANTPIYYDGALFYFSGYGQGGGLLEISDDASAIKELWFNPNIDNRMGGAVLVDGYLYSSGDKNRQWRCLNWDTGKEMYVADTIAKGVVIAAEGMLYCYSERGELALVKATPSGFDIVSVTKVNLGSGQHLAHPVIHRGTLYIRHGSTLIAYNIKE
ncbi:MAG: alcohol dehydrogenase [Bacteroidetes bacterium]|nr:MAG: alcohol dehydrogenase [Bacteroidota bacterium]